jgi:hypothetical protein
MLVIFFLPSTNFGHDGIVLKSFAGISEDAAIVNVAGASSSSSIQHSI